ncbi:hypothetical protein FOZ63_003716, partial [Perkinsus olseni]
TASSPGWPSHHSGSKSLRTRLSLWKLSTILGLGLQEPLEPSVIRLCHSESNRTSMELPCGSVLLSWEPLLSEENARH